ncbi:MFS transporter [Streptomyces ipomoeae]|uniref:Transporter, major facilitator family protein n=2 Tax=Streptomyces ipomoeae TaxID=103232 RepID=L1L883_9ACTN|nr:MFS transporter [Streptomyces ipomoeae]EKX68818.1 transporter, major facilitator family protein [Streptomyces ipomoeae 91-03]MDX2700531.1 MFS transporter [Streptomyces ipomoeae]MDX2828174.1 MFS transporter [Streptomyces ipomoeae]MDX2846175.1 MFS transporter [Streptomyces ipomoeae]MDX2880717.1 MFS transporter [Streptomyces ipomoeae]
MASTVTSNTSKTSRPGYGQLLRTRGAWTFLLPGFAARQPFAMLTLSLVLLVQHTTGSYGAAGAVAAVTGVSMALFAPYSGRLADRYGQRAVLLPGVVLHTLAGGSLTALALADAPLWALFAAAVPTGASVPQIGPMVRARWGVKLKGSPLMTTAAAFESVTDELTFVLGPLLATALCTAVHPAAGLLAEAALTLVGGLLFAAQRGTQPEVVSVAHARVEHASALSVPGVRVLIVTFLGIGSVFGGMQVSLAAFSESIGAPGLNGVLYGVFAAGNMISGLVCGAMAWKVAPQRRLIVGYAALALTASALWTADSVLVLAALGLLVGMCIAPALITGYTLVEGLVPAGARTEAFTWLTGAVALGQAAAVTAAGQLEDRLWGGAGFLVPMAGTALALATLVALRSRLATRPRSRTVARVIGHRVPVTVD